MKICPLCLKEWNDCICRVEDKQPAKVSHDAVKEAENRLDQLFLTCGWEANHPAMLDWVTIKFALKDLFSFKLNAETDLDHYKLVFTGEWPNSIVLLENALKNAREKAQKDTN